MIPEFNQSGVLPPFQNEQGPTVSAGMSPFKTTITEFVQRYAHSQERINILKGLIDYRQKLRDIGITNGFQWLDGSFVENVESNRGRPPADIDLVTFASRPIADHKKWQNFVHKNKDLFHPGKIKQKYHCDAYFVDLITDPIQLVSTTRYWFGLFSHQRESCLWKGLVEIPITCLDDKALKILDSGTNHA